MHFLIRVFVLVFLVLMGAISLFSWVVTYVNKDVRSHQCEQMYNLWLHCITLACGHGVVFLSYFLLWNPPMFRVAVVGATVYMFVMFMWGAFVVNDMRHICLLFYHIKYRDLLRLVEFSMFINFFMWLFMMIYACCTSCGWMTLNVDTEDDMVEDPIMVTKIFMRRDETWVPPLFEAPEVDKYKEGVSKWSEAANQRVAHLQTTLDAAEKIRKGSENQSMLLRQVTNLVVETETKVTKTSTYLEQQEKIIGEFQNDFKKVQEQLKNVSDLPSASFELCTWLDCCCWICIFAMIVGIALAVQYGIHQWFGLFGFGAIDAAIGE